jgi:hypothetical protein
MTGASKTINASQAINNLTIANTASVTIATNNLTVGGNLAVGEGTSGTFGTNSKNLNVTGTTTINSGATLNLNAASATSTLTITGTLTNSGALTLENDANTLSIVGSSGSARIFTGNDIDYNTNSVTLTNIDYDPDVSLDETGDTIVLGDSNCLFDGISIGASTTFNAGTNSFSLSGNFADSGTFTATAGTATFNGTNQSISGSTTFYNLSKTGSNTLTFEAGKTQTIMGTTTLKGTSYLTLRSSTDDQQWFIDPQGSKDISNVDVKDSYNRNGDSTRSYINPANSLDSGNNTWWFETTPPPPPPPPPPPEEWQPGQGGYEEGEKYKKRYPRGKYRTTVIVFEGRVVVAPYDERGARYEEGMILTGGEKITIEGEIK